MKIRVSSLTLPLDHSDSDLRDGVAERLGLEPAQIESIEVFRRSADARQRRSVKLVYTVDVSLDDAEKVLERLQSDSGASRTPDVTYHYVAKATRPPEPRPVVIGLGPCGLFAGLVLAQMGLRPLILERGKKVRERTKDTFGFWRQGRLDPESNVQFGEGGAGTFSDGKLYSRVRDKQNYGRKVLTEFVEAGAPPEILYEGRPHIGTYRLVPMLERMRAKIEGLGGEIHFQSRVDDFILEGGSLRGIRLASGEELRADHVVLALGHSARDTFRVLYERGVETVAKPFSIGFRVEHPQSMVDQCRYGRFAGHPLLGAADYRLTHHCRSADLEGRTVYSFCMCPGGLVVASASEEGGVVTNGMSQYDRGERNANAGLVVDLSPEDLAGGVFAGMDLQRDLEQRAFAAAGGNYEAPGQLIGDFLAQRPSTSLGGVLPSYQPGVHLTELDSCLPDFALAAIREAIPAFDRKIPGFAREDAVLTGVETRTSSPIRLPRASDLQSVNVRGLFPAGEGAGYAGGILSAGIDGIRVAEAVARVIGST